MRTASEHSADRGEDRPGQVHGEPRAEARPVVRVQRERVVPPLPAETAEDRAVDLGSVLFGAGRAEEGGPAPARIPQAAPHGLGPASRLGAGRAAQGVEPGTGRGTVEGPVRRRPVDADQPRVPLPVDPRQAAAGAGPAPVSGARQETPDEEKGQEGERAAHPDARAHRGPARGGRIQEGVRPFRVGHGGRRRAVEALHEHAGGAQEPQAVRPARRRQERVRQGMPPAARVDRTWDNGTEASLHVLVDEALGMLTYFADPYSSWQRGGNENRNGGIRRYLPKGTGFEDLAQEDLDAIVGGINDTPMKLLGYKTPNEVWDEEMAKLQSKQADPKPAVALTS